MISSVFSPSPINGANASSGRILVSATEPYLGFLVRSANVERKELIVLSHGNGHFHLYFQTTVPDTYYSAIELMEDMHETWVEDRYTGEVWGRYHEPTTTQTLTVTLEFGADTVTYNSHGILNGTPVSFTAITGTITAVSAGVTYYVKNKTTNTFQLSLDYDGTVVDFLTANGGGTLVAPIPLTGFINWTEVTT